MKKRAGFAAGIAALVVVGSIAAAQSQNAILDDLFAARDNLSAGIDKACLQQPDHPRCATTTTSGATTTAAPSTTAAPTTTVTTAPPPTTTATTLPATTTTAPAPTTTAPPAPAGCVGFQVAAGANLVTLANQQPAGTVFCLSAGTYATPSPIAPKANQAWVGALGAQGQRLTIITGNNSQAYMLQCHIVANCQGLQFKNFILEKYNSPFQQSPIQGPWPVQHVGWLVDNIESRENAGIGLSVATGSTVRNSFIHHNRQMGVGGQGSNITWENNEIAFNNYLHQFDPNNEAGGSKWVNTTDLIVRNNYVHDNCGPGLWTDIENIGTLYEGNRVVNNGGEGIFHEISQRAIIRNNYVEGNARGIDANPNCSHSGGIFGIYVSSSRDVEVYGNVLVDNEGGIGSQQANRGTSARGPLVVQNLDVHDNDVTYQIGFSGFRYVGGPVVSGLNVDFERNAYHVPTTSGTWWMWQPSTGGGLKTWSQWQALGFDDSGLVD